MSNLHIPPHQWLAEQFEFEYCSDCSGDACHHTPLAFLGNWFARCDYPRDAEGKLHPVIQAYREQEGFQ